MPNPAHHHVLGYTHLTNRDFSQAQKAIAVENYLSVSARSRPSTTTLRRMTASRRSKRACMITSATTTTSASSSDYKDSARWNIGWETSP